MDSPGFAAGKSPRRELQGPRPTPLKVHKASHKIRKPPVVPQPSQPPPAQYPPPVIIYTVSPKVIHTHPSEFMTLVQRLTGSSSTSSSSIFPSSSTFPSTINTAGAISPASRFATIEKTNSTEKKKPQSAAMGMLDFEGVEMSTAEIERSGNLFAGILSPGPASLQPISASFFSPPSFQSPNPLNFFHDLSPILQGNKNYIEGSSFMPSPNSNFLSPHITSPTPPFDIFNNFFN